MWHSGLAFELRGGYSHACVTTATALEAEASCFTTFDGFLGTMWKNIP